LLLRNPGDEVTLFACLDKTASGSLNGIQRCPDRIAPRNDNLPRGACGRQLDGKIRPFIDPDDLSEASKMRQHGKYGVWGPGGHASDFAKLHPDGVQCRVSKA